MRLKIIEMSLSLAETPEHTLGYVAERGLSMCKFTYSTKSSTKYSLSMLYSP